MAKYQGLTSEQVKQSRLRFGTNEPERKRSTWQLVLLDVLMEPMLILLIVCCAIYFLSGEKSEGWIMLAAIIMVSGISVFQQIRSENALKALNKLTSITTTVLRDSKEVKLNSHDLVKGDIIFVSEGNIVPADAKIIEVNDLSADESMLTGESLPVNKSLDEIIYSGTILTSGLTWAEVTSVGKTTKIGQLGSSLLEIKKEKTPLQLQVSKFVTRMALVGVVAFIFVWGFNYLESKDIVQSLLHGLTLAMSVLPEEIPVALSTFMALGAYRMIKNKVLTRQPQTVEALGAATVICVDKTGTLTENRMTVAGWFDFKSRKQFISDDKTENNDVILFARLASEEVPFDPMEKAIHEKYNSTFTNASKYTKIAEYPLSGTPPFMTHVFTAEDGSRIIAAKGAPEGILKLSNLNAEEIKHIEGQIRIFASKGMRVLGVSKGLCEETELPSQQQQIPMKFIGLIALNDPLRKNIPMVISDFYKAGINVKMITGDFSETAISIAKMAGIKNNEKSITGTELTSLNETEFNKAVSEYTIFSRVLPEIKLRIVNALKSDGEVVAMTGDGVNDAPALKSAHIGIAMGKRGSEVARRSSSLVLTDDDLGGMVKAVEFGRTIYSNLKKAIQYIISIHIPLISIVTIPLLLGWKFPNIFSPVHVIFLELIMGPTCSIAYENEPMENGLMNKKPRKMTDSLFTWTELSRSILQGGMLTIGLMALYYIVVMEEYSEGMTRTMIFTMLVMGNILLTLTGRSIKDPVYKTIGYKNNLIRIVIAFTLLLLFALLFWHPAMRIFEFEHLNTMQIAVCAGMAAVSVLWIDLYKIFTGKNHKIIPQ